MVNTKKFSEFSTANLNDNTNQMVGFGNGINIRADKVTTWTTLTRPATPFNGLLGYNTNLNQYEYWNAALPPSGDWVQLPSGSIVEATYILQTPNTLLPNAQALSALSTGILKSTTVTGVLSISPALTSIDNLASVADEMLYSSGVDTYSLTPLTPFARTLLDDASALAARTTLSLGTASTKNATDNGQATVVSASGAFTVGHLLVAADTSGTAMDGGVPFGGGTVTSISEGTGIALSPNPITTTGTVSFASIDANSLWVNNTGGAAVPTVTPLAALTKVDDTNVTLTLGGTPATALINSVSLTLGWTGQLALSRGGTNANLTAVNGGIVYSNATALAISAAGSSGQLLQSAGAATPVWTTATFPSTAGTAGKILISNGTNYITSTSIWPNTVGTSGKIIISDGTSNVYSTPTFPNAATSTGSFMYANGTDWVASTSLWPNTVGSAGKILRSNGTTNAYSTATFADTYSASNLLYSNGANTVTGLATVNNGTLTTNASGVPTWLTQVAITKVNTQTITATGAFSYTPTTGTQYAIFELQGGGGGSGGGGGAASQGSAPSGGGGGAYQKILVTGSSNLAAITGSVGVGGSAGAAAAGNGGTGGNTTLVINGGSTWTAAGGGAGQGSAATSGSTFSNGVTGGTNTSGTNGTLLLGIVGGTSGLCNVGAAASSAGSMPSYGGSSHLGGSSQSTLLASVAGLNYGGGASATANCSAANQAGAAGGQGIVIVTEFISIY